MVRRIMIPALSDVQENPVVSHSDVLKLLTDQLQLIDFTKKANLQDGKGLVRKHYVVITIEEILRLANENKWSLCVRNGTTYVFNGAYWQGISKHELLPFLGIASQRLGVDWYNSKYHFYQADLLKQFLCSAHLPNQCRNNDEVKINLHNGTFKITPQLQVLKNFDREDFITYQLPFSFNNVADAPQFINYLNRVLPDVSNQNILAEYIGYVFVRTSTLKLEKSLILLGGGANGKSVFFEIIKSLLGSDNISSYGLQSLTNESGYQRAMLGNKLLNYSSEISNNMNSALFKQLVSGEPIEARLPYGEPLILNDYAKLMFNANVLPRDVEHTDAFFRRFLILNFDVTIPENERDPELAKKIISDELPGVFNWVLHGLNRILVNKKFTQSASVDQMITQYRQQSDTVHLFLEDGNYVPDITEEIPLKVLYVEFRSFCIDNGYKASSIKAFSDRLRRLGISIHRKKNGMVVDVTKECLDITASATLCTSNINLN